MQRSGRVVCVIGLPCSGKTTLVQIMLQSSKEVMAHISTGDIARELSSEAELQHMAEGNLYPFEDKIRAKTLELVLKRQAQGAEVVFLDGAPRTGDQVKWLLENQVIGFETGIIIQVRGDNLLERAAERFRDDQDSYVNIVKKIETQVKLLADVENEIFRYGIPYFTVHNSELEAAAKDFAKRVGLRK